MVGDNNEILILGTAPPPIGGVTIHVKRLCLFLEMSDISWRFVDFKRTSVYVFIGHVLRHRIIHLHTSNVFLQFILSLFCFLTVKKLIITYHGNIGRYRKAKTIIQRWSIRLSSIPIVINQHSYELAKKANMTSMLMTAFIPAVTIHPLDIEVLNDIRLLKQRCDAVYCTNAFNVSYDRDGHEIYQITQIVLIFNKLTTKGLIISDPSGNYIKLLRDNKIEINSNIYFLSFNHDFNAVIQEADIFIRFTTTDGDSLSVKEALSLGRQVIASSVVDRPSGVILVKTINDLEHSIRYHSDRIIPRINENAAEKLVCLYRKFL